MQHRLVIPDWTPVLTNHWYGRHWRVRHRLKKEQSELIGRHAWVQELPKATGLRRVALEVHGYPRGRLPDRDAFDKVMLDSLVDCGLLTDDSPKGLEGRMAVEVVRAKERRTVITLEDVA